MTTATPTFDTPTTPSRSTTTRWWIALAAAVLAVAGATGAVVLADSDTDGPVTPVVERVTEVVDETPALPVGPVSADAAERRVTGDALARCSGMSADAAERCLASGR